jgi:hypothetical protein
VAPDLILFLAVNPVATHQPRLDEECAVIERELRAAASRELALESRWAVSIDELMHHLNALRPTVIHFSGHAGGDGEATGTLHLQDATGAPQRVSAEALTAMIESAGESARIVVLNACYSDAYADALCRVVDCVVGMTGPTGDDAALAFAVSFYRALAHQRSVGNAVAQVEATLAAKQLLGRHVPRCRTRAGSDVHQIMVRTRAERDESWTRRFEAIPRLAQAAHDKLESDPLSAAVRARQAIEHIVDYLCERELAVPVHDQPPEARFDRVDAKLVIAPLVANHVRAVLAYTGLTIQTTRFAREPAPAQLGPCLGSLALAVEWFFHEYLKRPELSPGWGGAGWPIADPPPAPDAIPLNSTMTTVADTATRAAIDLGEIIPIWRAAPAASQLQLVPADGDARDQRAFRIEDPARIYLIGRTDQRSDGTRNDFVIPSSWTSVSRDQAYLATRDGDILLMNTSSKNSVFVDGEPLVAGAARLLRHGDVVQLGRCIGTFCDGRYYTGTPSAAVDRRTGLLSRLGLIAEISGALASGDRRVLFVLRCPDQVAAATRGGTYDPELIAASVALAIHRHAPAAPVARFGMYVAALVGGRDEVDPIAEIAQHAVGGRCVCGFATLVGVAKQAIPRLESCLGALNRIAIAGEQPLRPEDLARHALVATPLHAFAGHARSLCARGGGAVLFALGDLPRLNHVAPQAVPVLERELLEVLGARMGPRDAVSLAEPGVVLFATSGDVERCAHEISVAWHARGPLAVDRLEIDRWLSTRVLATVDLDGVAEHAVARAQQADLAADASGFPAPLALAAQAVDLAGDPVDRARALVKLAKLGWKLLAFVLRAAARGPAPPVPPDPAGGPAWPEPWRALARAAARRLEGQTRRLDELAAAALAADRDPVVGEAAELVAAQARLATAAHPDSEAIARALPSLACAVRALLEALAPLRGWTLVAIISSEAVDPDGTTLRIEYVDHTGPSARGSHQRVMVTSRRPLGPFVYLVRWTEGLAIALEPFVRRASNAATGDGELFLATRPIAEPGRHRYRSAHDTHEIEQVVTTRQLGDQPAGGTEDAATG